MTKAQSTIKGVPKHQFRRALAGFCGCAAQHTGWPCPTCFAAHFDDDTGEDWRAVLAYRGDYAENITGTTIRMCVDIEFNPDGSFKRHIFEEIPLADVETRIRRMAARLGVA
jgi:hypothetical protein